MSTSPRPAADAVGGMPRPAADAAEGARSQHDTAGAAFWVLNHPGTANAAGGEEQLLDNDAHDEIASQWSVGTFSSNDSSGSSVVVADAGGGYFVPVASPRSAHATGSLRSKCHGFTGWKFGAQR
jgi:hypothetical protein